MSSVPEILHADGTVTMATPMTDIEKVARGICAASAYEWPVPKQNQVHWLLRAEAAIKVYQEHLKEQGLQIRPIEPTQEMLEAAYDSIDPESAYKAMNAAYEEKNDE